MVYYSPVGGIGRGRVRVWGERVGGGVLYNILIPRVLYTLQSDIHTVYHSAIHSDKVNKW
jgi:hypothetical protein